MLNDEYIRENYFYIEDMDHMYEEMQKEDAHFHHTIYDFISLDINESLSHMKEKYPGSWKAFVAYIKENEGDTNETV